MPAFSREFEQALHRTLAIANEKNHEYATLEHLLMSLTDSQEIRDAFTKLGLSIDTLRQMTSNYIDRELDTLVKEDDEADAKPTAGFQRVVQRAHIHVQSAGREEVRSLDGLIGIFAERESYAALFLKEIGAERGEVVALRSELESTSPVDILEAQERRRIVKIIPPQAPAPVRVMELNGRLVRESERQGSLSTTDDDFMRWRQPAFDHISELLNTDFQKGTNHSRLRARLASLANLLEGGVDDLKERQFAIGYDVDRLGGLLAVYNSGSDDVPNVNSAILQDLTRLHISLSMGVDKLESWSEFRQAALTDNLSRKNTAVDVVADALSDFALQMEQRIDYFDPELPATFRFLSEAIKDPEGAEKTVIYGGVKSAENLLSFLAQKSIDVGRSVADNAGKYISGAVAASLIGVLANSASSISNVLPAGWTWLKPLLELLAKTGGH